MCFKNLPGAVIGQDLVDPPLGGVELLLPLLDSCDVLHPAADPGPAAAAQVPQPAGQEEEEQAHPRPQRRGLTAGETWCIKVWILLIQNQASTGTMGVIFIIFLFWNLCAVTNVTGSMEESLPNQEEGQQIIVRSDRAKDSQSTFMRLKIILYIVKIFLV